MHRKMEALELVSNSEIKRFVQVLRDLESVVQETADFSPAIFDKFLAAEHRITDSFSDVEEKLGGDPQIIHEARRQFRQEICPWYYQSFFMKRATEKPFGYSGDYEILEGIYDNMPLSDGFGWYLDRLFLTDQLAVAVRYRKDTIRDWLQSELEKAAVQKNELKILNIGCGSCREWYELFAKVDPGHLQLTCIDFDQVALNYARRRLSDRQKGVDLKFVRDNALRLAVRQDNENRFGLQDIIYSFGLYDYLTDKTLKRLLKNQYDLLKPGGRMVLTFKDRTKYNSRKHAWFCDWYFEQRSEEDIFKLLHEIGIDKQRITTVWEQSGTVVFFQIGKEPAA